MSHTGRMPEVKNRMFTIHPLFTTYHYEIKGENRKVNSVNSSFEKKFFYVDKRCTGLDPSYGSKLTD
ncbi:attP region and P4int integrase [Escherichia coli]|nr:attP region and P4int integrase [Escherichia coli]